MTASVFVDTNVLVYAYDRSEPVKQSQAEEVLHRVATSGLGAISTQVLSEFFNATTRKLNAPLSPQLALASLEKYDRSWPILAVTPQIILEAARGVADLQLNFWDAQIWATAKLNQIPVVFSEDFNVGAMIEGIRFVNPLQADFEVDRWLR